MTPDELRAFLQYVDKALRDEHVPSETQRRIMNRLIWGDPAGNDAGRIQDPTERLERLPGPMVHAHDVLQGERLTDPTLTVPGSVVLAVESDTPSPNG
jgi:hypothetical protein